MADEGGINSSMTSSEAHLDLLVAEELAVNPQFLRQFLEGCTPRRADLNTAKRDQFGGTDLE